VAGIAEVSEADGQVSDSLAPDIVRKEEKDPAGPLFTDWSWDGTPVGPGKGLKFIVNVRKFEYNREKVWMDVDTRPAVVLNNLIAKQESVPDLLELIAERSREFMIVNSVTTLHRLARFSDRLPELYRQQLRHDGRFQRLLHDARQMFPPKRPLELANMSWALARLRLMDDPLMAAIS